MLSRSLGVLRFVSFLLWTFACLAVYLPWWAVSLRVSRAIRQFYFRGVARICGFRIQVRGVPLATDTHRPVLFVCNHSNYFDIPLLASVLPASFVSKAEVRQWPFFGFLAWADRTVFVERRRGAAAKGSDAIAERLRSGGSLVLFPEGTSSDGNKVLPFKSSMLSVAETPLPDGQPLVVQPLSFVYNRLDGYPMGRGFRPFYAWYGDMELMEHMMRALSLGSVVGVDLVVHPPVTIADFKDRKALTNHCHDVVARGVALSLAGELDRLIPPPPPSLPQQKLLTDMSSPSAQESE